MNSNRTERIASIIQQRYPLIEKVVSVEKNLRSVSSALYKLEENRQNLLKRIDNPNILGYLQEIDCNRIQLKIASELEALGKLKVRFCRNTLNIGVVGRARQGKSRLLQSLTGLTAAEIPDGDRQHCTGVRSIVYHNPHVESYGEVWFHTERSFLDEVISPYYEQLRLGAKPITIEAFANKSLPPLPKELPGYAEPGAMYEHLTKYHVNISKYQHLLREASPRRILPNEIREYVAQDTPDGQRIFFNYLAVRQVRIVCGFPNADVGQIALVDMPGLGDTGIGDAERLMKTLGQDVDAVLFIRMPKSSGDYWADVDVRLYDTAHAALAELPIALWSFMVLNQTASNSKNGDNLNNCQDLVGDITNKHIHVKECITANCANPQEANKVLDRVLDYLAANITNLDREYATSCQERLLQLQNEINIELKKSRHLLGKTTLNDNWFPLFEQLFEQLWNNLASGLESLLRHLKERRNSHSSDFKREVVTAIQACYDDTGIPDLEQIERRRDLVGGYPNAYYEYLHEIRAHLSQHFLLLDQGLKRSLLSVKLQLVNVLLEQGLGELADARGDKFLNEIASQLHESLPKLKLGFQVISEFDMSYRELIQHRTRQHLDVLTPDETPLQISSSPSATEVLANLKTLHAEAVYGCETALENLLCEPSQAAFAIVEEFVDRVLRAEGAKTEWRIFLEEVRSFVWQDEFEELGNRTRLRKEWLDSIDTVATANQLNFMQF